jgi:hypothetical protein
MSRYRSSLVVTVGLTDSRAPGLPGTLAFIEFPSNEVRTS